MKYGDAVDRIAIVCDEKWRDQAMMFVAADLRKGPVVLFPEAPSPKTRLADVVLGLTS